MSAPLAGRWRLEAGARERERIFLPTAYRLQPTAILLAGAEGFEPPNGGIKTRCLTTWRRPNFSQTCCCSAARSRSASNACRFLGKTVEQGRAIQTSDDESRPTRGQLR